jgi:nicotinamide-nucleotide amidase
MNTNSMEDLASAVGEALKQRGLHLVTAESCTGGGLACAVTDVAGSSAWFERGFITYSDESKLYILKLRPDTLRHFGSVSEPAVREMTWGALHQSPAQIAVAISGIAGPDGGKSYRPVGTVWFAWEMRHGQCISKLHQLTGNRAEIREQAVNIALQGILDLIELHPELA